MRLDSTRFAQDDRASGRSPRFVIRIEFPTASVHCTSHDDIPGIGGIVVESVLQEPSAISQKLEPDAGRSTIGSFSFKVVDLQSAFTDAIKTHWFDEEGLRDRQVELFIGYEGYDFDDFQLFTTQIVVSDDYKDGVYSVQCRDITREQNKEIFRPVATTLRQSVSATDSVIPVSDTTAFVAVQHDASYSDAPGQLVYYFRIQDEIIRSTEKDLNQFTHCVRGVLNTVAKPHAISETGSQDRQPKVEEYIYLEGPGPKLAKQVLTGEGLPDHWSLLVDGAYVRESDFDNVGKDLWDSSDETNSLILRFEGLKAQDGKRFLEKEIYLLLGCFSPVYSDGSLGLRRMSPLVSNAAPVVTLTESVITDLGTLQHDGESMHNQFRILWAWDSLAEDYVRESRYIDANSIEVHGESELLTYEFRGLHGERHTDATIAQRLASIRDRYATPPERISVSVFGSLNRIEIGDVVRLKLPEQFLRDYALETADFNRSFEVHQQTYNAANGEVTLELFGSTSRPQAQPPVISDFHALSDSWYTSAGTALSTVLTIASNVVQAGSYTINGGTTLGANGSIFYHDNDLTIADGADVAITGNVQLRIKGFLQINGDVDGTGGGKSGVADPGTGPWDNTTPGNPGYVGHARGWDGIRQVSLGPPAGILYQYATIPARMTRGAHDAFPALELSTIDDVLVGLPDDLRGTGGGPGGRVIEVSSNAILLNGGTGVAGGSGLAIICRGLTFGASGSITLDGNNSSATGTTTAHWGPGIYSGAGAPGGPGAMLVLLDGSDFSFPLISGKFFARSGTVPVQGQPVPNREGRIGKDLEALGLGNVAISGYADPDTTTLSGFDYSTVAFGVQYLSEPVDPEADQHPRPPAPTGLNASSTAGGNLLAWTPPDPDLYNVIEVYASITNQRSDAVFIGETKSSTFHRSLPLGGREYYWIRAARTWADGRVPTRSEWEPIGESGGVVSNAETPGEAADSPADLFATGMVNGIRFTWAIPAVGRLLGKIQLYEGSAGSSFEDAALVWEGYGMSYFLPRYDTTVRDYWIRLYRGGQYSVPEPDGSGLSAASSSFTSALIATPSVTSHTMRKGGGVGPATLTTPSTLVSVSGGTPSYTHSWAFVSGGSGITINSPVSPATTFSATSTYGTSRTGTVRDTVTDSLGLTTYVDVSLKFVFASPIF